MTIVELQNAWVPEFECKRLATALCKWKRGLAVLGIAETPDGGAEVYLVQRGGDTSLDTFDDLESAKRIENTFSGKQMGIIQCGEWAN